MFASLAEVPGGHYKLYADITKIPTGAENAIAQRQTQTGEWLSVNSRQKDDKKHVYLSDITLDEFRNSITMVFNTQRDHNQLIPGRLISEKQ